VAEVSDTLAWLAQGPGGGYYAVVANGHSIQTISNPAIEAVWGGYSVVADAFAYSYVMNGHEFYVLTFPSANATWNYDMKTGYWFQTSTYAGSGSFYTVNRHAANCHAFWNGGHYVGDWRNGNIYQILSSVYTDNGQPIVSIRTCPTLTNEMRTTFYSKLEFDVETGSTDPTVTTSPGMTLDWSSDGGRTWSNPMIRGTGTYGDYKRRVAFRRLGRGRRRTFRVMMSDPVKKVIAGAWVDAMEGSS
jgi:hypothetical protein